LVTTYTSWVCGAATIAVARFRPGAEFVRAVQVVIAGLYPGSLTEPLFVVAAMDTHVTDRGCGSGAGFYGIVKEGLVDVHEPNSPIGQLVVKLRCVPGGVAYLQDQ
jgi:hypothetical protein